MQIVVSLTTSDDTALQFSAISPFNQNIVDYGTVADDYYMRALADLQGDGFPLDGSCELYEWSAGSASTGKIGIRGDTGEDFGIRIATSFGTTKINDITIKATGAASVTYGVETYTFNEENTTLININATSADLTFTAADSTHRIEISLLAPGVNVAYTNDSIISCELDLRSDLKPIDPTLPESEINIRVYEPNDVRDIMNRVFEENPVTYTAGYAGDMSPVRYFYLAEPAQWKDKVLTLHAVDSVHLLDTDVKPFYIGGHWDSLDPSNPWYNVQNIHQRLYKMFVDQITGTGVHVISTESNPLSTYSSEISAKGNVSSIVEEQPVRSLLANVMNLLHQTYAAGYFNGLTAFWPTFVDAGRPTIYWTKPTSKWDIFEADCGDIVTNIDRKITKIKAPNKRVQVKSYNANGMLNPREGVPRGNQNVGNIDIAFQDAGVYNFQTYVSYVWMYLTGLPTPTTIIQNLPILDGEIYDYYRTLPAGSSVANSYGKRVYTGQVEQGWWQTNAHGGNNCALFNFWDNILWDQGYVEGLDDTISIPIYGGCYNVIDNPTTYTADGIGITAEPKETFWIGRISAGKYGDATKTTELLPSKGFKELLARSTETGSFTWKGDPRMQPRDVFTFHYLDGTTELRTIESIELKHEGGGTVASITYRKGIV